jgi:voltage-gated potassium channel
LKAVVSLQSSVVSKNNLSLVADFSSWGREEDRLLANDRQLPADDRRLTTDDCSMKALRNLRLIGIALALVIISGTAGFHFIEGWSWFDGFYMVVTTLTTIGYQETHPLSQAGRVFNICLIATGVSLVFLSIGALTQALLEFELRSFFGRRKMERDIDRLTDHYIICGAGRVGRSAGRELARRPVPFVIVENSDAKAARYSQDWLMLVGDATKEQTLREAHIERARGLVAATTTDATNLYIILTARGLNPKLKIIARASEEDAEKHLLKAGADFIVSPYSFAGQRIAQTFLRPHVVSFLDTATTHLGMDLEIGEISVGAGSGFAGKTIETSRIRQERGVIVLAIKRGQGMRFNPAPDDRIEAGDFLIAMGEPSQLRQVEQMAVSKP